MRGDEKAAGTHAVSWWLPTKALRTLCQETRKTINCQSSTILFLARKCKDSYIFPSYSYVDWYSEKSKVRKVHSKDN